jgi:hypothetical protein
MIKLEKVLNKAYEDYRRHMMHNVSARVIPKQMPPEVEFIAKAIVEDVNNALNTLQKEIAHINIELEELRNCKVTPPGCDDFPIDDDFVINPDNNPMDI